MEQIGEADPAEQFRTNAIRDAVDDLGAILGRVDMNSEWPLAERHVHDSRNRFGHLTGIGIRWFEGAQPLQRGIRPMLKAADACGGPQSRPKIDE